MTGGGAVVGEEVLFKNKHKGVSEGAEGSTDGYIVVVIEHADEIFGDRDGCVILHEVDIYYKDVARGRESCPIFAMLLPSSASGVTAGLEKRYSMYDTLYSAVYVRVCMIQC